MANEISDTNIDQYLQALSKEVVKLFKVYDGSNRLIEQYEALANTAANGVCLKTQYAYVDATTNLEKMKESLGVWLASYEI